MLDKREVYKIDKNGYIAETYVAEFDKSGNPITELDADIVTDAMQDGLCRARWTGAEWVEDMSQEEIDTLKANAVVEPTLEERLEALEVLELERIFGGM